MNTYDLVTTSEAQLYLKLDTLPAGLDMLITNLSARIEAYTGRWFVARPVVDVLDSGGGDLLFLSRYPVQGTPVVTDLTTGLPVTGFLTYAGRGYLYLGGGWEAGRQRYKVEYTAGMCPDTPSVPADIRQACLEWVAARYNRIDPAITREQLGDYSYSADESDGMPANVRAALSLYVIPRGC
ncbi:hypothetical protein [Desulfotomaculum copahuensis]|uniref:Phage gp6-like head-tail connector protein n=1 Tax=Desulfotomaculum copahuensis TaxID=1838280 RepID=A0A1B7LAF2_9FIRM|nr:hypothetical protein [Desulfotomaculum copahuensis]OAT79309.1 hypothetical protein A6M21_16235 [Desulfotomaculum copahuensis]